MSSRDNGRVWPARAIASQMSEVEELIVKLQQNAQLSSRGRAIERDCFITDKSGKERKIQSWKFNEWDYGKNNITLPCNARGLFISADGIGQPRIMARGYDKFFNIDEVAKTHWDWIKDNTQGPYEVSVKANGCIIFISGLEDGTLAVCSKHSIGHRDDVDRNHAEAGEKSLLDQLAKIGMDPTTLALDLFSQNITAVAEYCDDSFEEHILEYVGERSGLYLHGVNMNTSAFHTWPLSKVNELANRYNFKKVECLTFDSIEELQNLFNECSKTGVYHGVEIEGFVIRSHLQQDDKASFFFKYKLEEPYLMYRQWREVTKDYINTKSRVFKFKKHKFITNKYLDFVIPLLDNDATLCENYLKGFGIIKLRNLFLKSYGMTGFEILNSEKINELENKNAIDYEKVDENTKFLIFPISVIGCGKTTTAITLKNLYPESWAHVQNDDVHGKDKSQLMKRSLGQLSKAGVKCVFVDRNNHQFKERQQLFQWLNDLKEDFLPYNQNIKVIGVSFAPYDKMDKIKTVTVKRVLERGDNHQTIKLQKYGEQKIVGIMSGFWRRYQPVVKDKSPDNLFDLLIELPYNEVNSSLINTKIILENLHREYPILVPEIPDENAIKSSFDLSLEHKIPIKPGSSTPNTKEKKNKPAKKDPLLKPKKLKPVYFSANVSVDLVKSAIDTLIMQNLGKIAEEGNQYLTSLFAEDKFQKAFHVTLSHRAQSSSNSGDERGKRNWERYTKHYEPIIKMSESTNNSQENTALPIRTGDIVSMRLSKLIWDDKIVTIIVDLLENTDNSIAVRSAEREVINGLNCTNLIPHITIGILQDGVKAYYSNELCNKIASGGNTSGCFELNFVDSKVFDAEVYINL